MSVRSQRKGISFFQFHLVIFKPRQYILQSDSVYIVNFSCGHKVKDRCNYMKRQNAAVKMSRTVHEHCMEK